MRNKNIILTLFIISFAIKCAFGVIDFLRHGTEGWMDAWAYIYFAKNLISQGLMLPNESLLPENALGLPPGYSFTILPLIYIFGDNYIPVIIFNAAIVSFVPVLIFLIVSEFTEKRFALIAASWSIIYIEYYLYVSEVLKESLLSAVFLFAIYLLLEIYKKGKPGYRHLALLALVTAYLFHIDERYFSFTPLFALVIFMIPGIKFPSKIRNAVVYGLIVVAFMLPWTLRNYYVHGKFVLITERTGSIMDKLTGNKNTDETKKTITEYFKAELSEQQIDSIKNFKPLYDNGNSKPVKHINEGLRYGIVAHKFSYPERVYAEFKEYWRPFRFSPGFVYTGFRFEKPWSAGHNAAELLCFGILIPFFLYGVYSGIRKRNAAVIIISAFIFCHMALHVFALYVRVRYRLPVDALIIIVSSYGLYELLNLIKERNRMKQPQQ